MADHILYCFAQFGNACTAALMLSLCGAGWVQPYELMPGHPHPDED